MHSQLEFEFTRQRNTSDFIQALQDLTTLGTTPRLLPQERDFHNYQLTGQVNYSSLDQWSPADFFNPRELHGLVRGAEEDVFFFLNIFITYLYPVKVYVDGRNFEL